MAKVVERWEPEDPASAAHLNEAADAINALASPGTIRRGQYGSNGITFDTPLPTDVALFELTEDITYPSPGDSEFPAGWDVPPDVPYANNCKQVWLKHASNVYATDSMPDEVVFFPTITSFTASDDPHFVAGDRVIATFDRQQGRWYAWAPPLDNSLQYFELKDAIEPGDTSATAYLRFWNGSAYETTTEIEFEVYDVLGIHRGRAKDAFSSPHDDGSFGSARFKSASGQWEIDDMTPHALMIHGQLTADLATTDSTTTIDGTEIMQPVGGIITNTDPAASITVNNLFSFEGDNDGQLIAVWNEEDEDWDIIQVECPA